MICLKELSLNDGGEVYAMLQEIAADDNGFHNKVCGMSYDQFREWLAAEYAIDHGLLEEWMVPQTSYWLYDGDRPVGYGRMRHDLNPKLSETGGHIGYAIRNTERGKGYGHAILSLLLDECKKRHLEVVQIGVREDNAASNRVVIRHGGKLVRTCNHKNIYHIYL